MQFGLNISSSPTFNLINSYILFMQTLQSVPMHKQLFNKEQTEPLLAVNDEPTTSLSVEGKDKRDGSIKREIKRTWNHLRISMILFFVATLGALGVLIYGGVLIAQASSNSRAMLDTLVADICKCYYLSIFRVASFIFPLL